MSVVAVDRALGVRGQFLPNGTVTDEQLEAILAHYGIGVVYQPLHEETPSQWDGAGTLTVNAESSRAERRWTMGKSLGFMLMHGSNHNDHRQMKAMPEAVLALLDLQAEIFAGWLFLANTFGRMTPEELAAHHTLPLAKIERWGALGVATTAWGSWLKGW